MITPVSHDTNDLLAVLPPAAELSVELRHAVELGELLTLATAELATLLGPDRRLEICAGGPEAAPAVHPALARARGGAAVPAASRRPALRVGFDACSTVSLAFEGAAEAPAPNGGETEWPHGRAVITVDAPTSAKKAVAAAVATALARTQETRITDCAGVWLPTDSVVNRTAGEFTAGLRAEWRDAAAAAGGLWR